MFDGPMFIPLQLVSPVDSQPNIRFYAPVFTNSQNMVNNVALPNINFFQPGPGLQNRNLTPVLPVNANFLVQFSQQRSQAQDFQPKVSQDGSEVKKDFNPQKQQQETRSQRDEVKNKGQSSDGVGEQLLNIKIFKPERMQKPASFQERDIKQVGKEENKKVGKEENPKNSAGISNKGKDDKENTAPLILIKKAPESDKAPKTESAEQKNEGKGDAKQPKTEKSEVGMLPSMIKGAKEENAPKSVSTFPVGKNPPNVKENLSAQKLPMKEGEGASIQKQQVFALKMPHNAPIQKQMEVQKIKNDSTDKKNFNAINTRLAVQKNNEPAVAKVQNPQDQIKASKDKNPNEKKEGYEEQKIVRATGTKYERKPNDVGEEKFLPQDKKGTDTEKKTDKAEDKAEIKVPLPPKEQDVAAFKAKQKFDIRSGPEKEMAIAGAIKGKNQEVHQTEFRLTKAPGQENITMAWLAALTPGKITREKRGERYSKKQKALPLKECKLSDLLYILLAALASGASSIDEIGRFMEKRAQWFTTVLGLKEGLPSRQMIWWLLLAVDNSSFEAIILPWLDEARGKEALIRSEKSQRPLLPSIIIWESELGLIIGQNAVEMGAENMSEEAVPLMLYTLNLQNAVVMAEGAKEEAVSRQVAAKKGFSFIEIPQEAQASEGTDEVCFESYLEGEDRLTVYVNPIEGEDFTAHLNVEYEVFGKGVSDFAYLSKGLKNPAEDFFPLFRMKSRIKKKTFWTLNVALDAVSEEFSMTNSRKNFRGFKNYVHEILANFDDGKLTIEQKMNKALTNNEYLYKLLSS